MGRTFKLIRDEDVSGVSGLGIVAEGVLFSNGHAALSWVNTPFPTTTVHPSGLESVLHVHGHGGRTRLVWDDEQQPQEFDEDDIQFLHTLIGFPAEPELGEFNGSARRLLGKIRSAMRLRSTVPAQKTVP